MSYFQQESPWSAIGGVGDSLRGVASTLAQLPLIQAQSREARAREGLYGAQAGYYRSRAAFEEAKQVQLNAAVSDAAPAITAALQGQPLSQEAANSVGRAFALGMQHDPKGTMDAVVQFGAFSKANFGQRFNMAGGDIRRSTVGPGESVVNMDEKGGVSAAFTAPGRPVGSATEAADARGEWSAAQAIFEQRMKQAELSADPEAAQKAALDEFQNFIRARRAVLPKNDTGAPVSRAFDKWGGVPMAPAMQDVQERVLPDGTKVKVRGAQKPVLGDTNTKLLDKLRAPEGFRPFFSHY